MAPLRSRPVKSLLRRGHKHNLLLALGFLAVPAVGADRSPLSSSHRLGLGAGQVSPGARQLANWIADRDDNQGLPLLIVDKPAARVFAIDAQGRLTGTAPVLLGLALGDVSPAGIGDRKLAAIPAADRITPAGRFVAAMGQNLAGKKVLWVDYAAALSLHPVITTKPSERRLERLATPTPSDNRISYGCINVPAEYFDTVVRPLFQASGGIVYILPDIRSIESVFFSRPAASANRTATREVSARASEPGG